MKKLSPCPCGTTPTDLFIRDSGEGGKYALAYGNCCGEWLINFRANYLPYDSDECKALAIEAWNNTIRK